LRLRDPARHGESLRRLHLDYFNNWSDSSYSASHNNDELEDLVKLCPGLEELGIGILDMNFGDSRSMAFRNFLPSLKSLEQLYL